MTYRMTVVLEYPDQDAAPRIGRETKDFGDFKVYAIQFSDALLELEVLNEYADADDIADAYNDPRMAVRFGGTGMETYPEYDEREGHIA